MQNPYSTLGVPMDATAEQIRSAYHTLVKRFHPDRVQDEAEQQRAQETLVQINLAYDEAMKRASFRSTHNVVIHNAREKAQRLFDQGNLDGAMRMLHRDTERDAGWFSLQGAILLKKGEAEAAHGCFRSAVRLDPDNMVYRRQALDAAVQMKKKKSTLRGRMGGWAKNVMNRTL